MDKITEHAEGLPGLTLAYIGDAVYELWVRNYLVGQGHTKVNDLHRQAVRYVKASTQARLVERLQPILTEEEMDVLKRGRNAKSGHQPKNTEMIDYRMSTGLEALVGFLYLKGRQDRLEEFFYILIELVREVN